MKTLLKILAFIGLGFLLPWLHFKLSGGESLGQLVMLFFTVNSIALAYLFDWYFRDNGGYEILINQRLLIGLAWVGTPILLHFTSHHLRQMGGSAVFADFLHGFRYWSFLVFLFFVIRSEYRDFRRFVNRSSGI